MTEIATIDWFGRWGTSVFSENTGIFLLQDNRIYVLTFVNLEIDKLNNKVFPHMV